MSTHLKYKHHFAKHLKLQNKRNLFKTNLFVILFVIYLKKIYLFKTNYKTNTIYCGRVARHGVSCRGRHPPCQTWQRHVTSRVARRVTTSPNRHKQQSRVPLPPHQTQSRRKESEQNIRIARLQ